MSDHISKRFGGLFSSKYSVVAVSMSNFCSDPSQTPVSPVAWQHINFYGRYEFTKSPESIDMEAIVQELARLPIKLDSTL